MKKFEIGKEYFDRTGRSSMNARFNQPLSRDTPPFREISYSAPKRRRLHRQQVIFIFTPPRTRSISCFPAFLISRKQGKQN